MDDSNKKYQLTEIVLLGVIAGMMDIGALLALIFDATVVGLVVSIPVYIFNWIAILLIYLYFFIKGSYGTTSTVALITGFGLANALVPGANITTVLLVTYIENHPKLAAVANVAAGAAAGEAAIGEAKGAEAAGKAGQEMKAAEEGAEAAGETGIGGMEAETAVKDVKGAEAAGQEAATGIKEGGQSSEENITKPEEEKEGANPEEEKPESQEEGNQEEPEEEDEEERSSRNYQPSQDQDSDNDEDEEEPEEYRKAA